MAAQSVQTCEQLLYDVYIKIHHIGQIKLVCTYKNLKETCEDYINFYKHNNKENANICIDVCNRNTGEVRRIWQNKQQLNLQFPTGQSPHME